MLSGLRVVPRDTAVQKGANSVEEGTRRSKRHKKDSTKKVKSKKRWKSQQLQASSDSDDGKDTRRRHGRSSKHKSSESSMDHDDSNTSSDREISRSRKHSGPRRDRIRGYGSSMSDTGSEDLGGKQKIAKIASDDEINEGTMSSIAARKAAGLEWMTRAPRASTTIAEPEVASSTVPVEEKVQVNPKELNPYLKDGGAGYPSENNSLQNMGVSSLSNRPVIGDGGLSWRLKALRRAKEQAEREGRKLDEVVEERWGSLAEMAVSVSARRAAHAHAHLHAKRDRNRSSNDAKVEGQGEESREGRDKLQDYDKGSEEISKNKREYLKDVSVRDSRMKAPRVSESLSWKRHKSREDHSMRAEDAEIFQAAASASNKFQNNGSFLRMFNEKQASQSALDKEGHNGEHLGDSYKEIDRQTGQMDSLNANIGTSTPGLSVEDMSANQLAAKALQLRLRGKSQEADELLKQAHKLGQQEAELSKHWQSGTDARARYRENQGSGPSLKSITADYERRTKKNDGDAEMVKSILHNKQYNKASGIENEYDFGTGFEASEYRNKKKASKSLGGKEAMQAMRDHKRIRTQEEHCQFCFGNASRPKHLTISIANSSYLMLPPREPLVEGHCYIVPMQHEGASRNLDENVWEELRNYKKCLLRMFAEQDKDVIFLETAIHLAKQRRHCLVECIPLPRQVAKQAPLYFKKAIDEAEDEWSQHNAKKLIDTSTKGLRACIPKNFPYFHVEFGLHAGYVHVIDNENEFKSHFGQDVVIGMLKLPEEEMHRRRRQQSDDQQKKSAIEFQKMWDPFDWTKMLD